MLQINSMERIWLTNMSYSYRSHSCMRDGVLFAQLGDKRRTDRPIGPGHKSASVRPSQRIGLLPTSCSPSHVLSSHVPLQELFIDSIIINYWSTYLTLVRPLKGRNPASVGLWNEGMTNSLTVDEGSQKLFSVIWGRFCRPVVQGRGSTWKYGNSHFTS